MKSNLMTCGPDVSTVDTLGCWVWFLCGQSLRLLHIYMDSTARLSVSLLSQGDQGFRGEKGKKGDKGETGDTGAVGPGVLDSVFRVIQEPL